MRQKGFTLIVVLLLLSLIGALGYIVYLKGYLNQVISYTAIKSSPYPSPLDTNPISTGDDNFEWITYKNDNYGFEFKYPSFLNVVTGNQTSFPTYNFDTIDLHISESSSAYDLSILPNSYSDLKEFYVTEIEKCHYLQGCEMYSPYNKDGFLENVEIIDFNYIKGVYVEENVHWTEPMSYAVWQKDKNIYEFRRGEKGNYETFYQILNTFKYTE